MKTVWLIKASGESNKKYEELLEKAGFDVNCISALSFSYVNESAILEALKNPASHDGIIFTSARAVEATYIQYSKLQVEQHQMWLKKKIFTIGESTASLVHERLHLIAIGGHTGNAQQLAEFIVQEIPAFNKPLLFPCSNLKKEELPKILAKNDRDFRAMTCYETSADPNLTKTLNDLLDSSGFADIVVFFSPSGVDYCLPALRKLNVPLSGAKFVALGATTNAALVSAGVPVTGVCSSPTPVALLHTVTPLL